jgi:hypothetical protein
MPAFRKSTTAHEVGGLLLRGASDGALNQSTNPSGGGPGEFASCPTRIASPPTLESHPESYSGNRWPMPCGTGSTTSAVLRTSPGDSEFWRTLGPARTGCVSSFHSSGLLRFRASSVLRTTTRSPWSKTSTRVPDSISWRSPVEGSSPARPLVRPPAESWRKRPAGTPGPSSRSAATTRIRIGGPFRVGSFLENDCGAALPTPIRENPFAPSSYRSARCTADSIGVASSRGAPSWGSTWPRILCAREDFCPEGGLPVVPSSAAGGREPRMSRVGPAPSNGSGASSTTTDSSRARRSPFAVAGSANGGRNSPTVSGEGPRPNTRPRTRYFRGRSLMRPTSCAHRAQL